MHNMVYLIGRLTKDVEIEENGATINIAVQRAFKNEEGIYETDFFDVKLMGQIATNTAEYCQKGDLVGIKGVLRNGENGTYVLTEKITFLASRKANEIEEEE